MGVKSQENWVSGFSISPTGASPMAQFTCSAGDAGEVGWEDPLKEEMATHSRILARKAGSKAAKCGLKTLFLILERRKEEKKMQGRGERRRQNRILAMKETSKTLNRELD